VLNEEDSSLLECDAVLWGVQDVSRHRSAFASASSSSKQTVVRENDIYYYIVLYYIILYFIILYVPKYISSYTGNFESR
jgi:hypothetical protein